MPAEWSVGGWLAWGVGVCTEHADDQGETPKPCVHVGVRLSLHRKLRPVARPRRPGFQEQALSPEADCGPGSSQVWHPTGAGREAGGSSVTGKTGAGKTEPDQDLG